MSRLWPDGLIIALFLLTTAVAAEPRIADAPRVPPSPVIVVTSTDDDTETMTLRHALQAAQNDPRDNLILFDETLPAAPIDIALHAPLVIAPTPTQDSGHDQLDCANRAVTLRAPNDGAALIIRGATITICGLTIRGGAPNAVVLDDAANATLMNCIITDSQSTGLSVSDTSQATIADSAINNNGRCGIALGGQSRAELTQCDLYNNGQWGALIADHAQLQADGVTIHGGQFAHIDVGNHALAVLRQCTLTEQARFGVVGSGDARIDLIACRVSDHACRAVELQGRVQATIRQTTIARGANFGIVLFGDVRLDMSDCRIIENRGHGLAIRDQATAIVTDSAFERNEFGGIGAPDAGDGGRLTVRRCRFSDNGLRPIHRGPLHIDPPPPTVQHIAANYVTIAASPHATVDLYADTVGQAAQFLRSIDIDADGAFTLPLDDVPTGAVITATSTTPDGQTSEFNVIAAHPDRAILAALLARTGPLSDTADARIDTTQTIHRWKPHTQLVFQFAEPPPEHVQRYARWFAQRVPSWTNNQIIAAVHFGPLQTAPKDATIVPIYYAPASHPAINGTGGTTFTRWNDRGYFVPSVRIFLAEPADNRQACPRVMVHELCHALGLYHVRAGLLSRMQGIPAPPDNVVNDFSPTPTFFDVLALQALYDPRLAANAHLQDLVALGDVPTTDTPSVLALARAAQPPQHQPHDSASTSVVQSSSSPLSKGGHREVDDHNSPTSK